MAENKKSFISYVDWGNVFIKLNDDEAGRLIKHLFNYVMDLNPPSPDKLTEIAFEPIKLQLKRDLVKWEGIRGEKSKAGTLGGIKSGESRRKQSQANEADASNAKQNEANEAVNVTVNANVNVIKEKEGHLLTFDQFRNNFPGTKRGNETEFDYLCKTHKDWKLVIPTLPAVIKKQKDDRYKRSSKGEFVPEWKNLKTWIYNRCWEDVIAEPLGPKQNNTMEVGEKDKLFTKG